MDFYYGSWNHREADAIGIGRNLDQTVLGWQWMTQKTLIISNEGPRFTISYFSVLAFIVKHPDVIEIRSYNAIIIYKSGTVNIANVSEALIVGFLFVQALKIEPKKVKP